MSVTYFKDGSGVTHGLPLENPLVYTSPNGTVAFCDSYGNTLYANLFTTSNGTSDQFFEGSTGNLIINNGIANYMVGQAVAWSSKYSFSGNISGPAGGFVFYSPSTSFNPQIMGNIFNVPSNLKITIYSGTGVGFSSSMIFSVIKSGVTVYSHTIPQTNTITFYLHLQGDGYSFKAYAPSSYYNTGCTVNVWGVQ